MYQGENSVNRNSKRKLAMSSLSFLRAFWSSNLSPRATFRPRVEALEDRQVPSASPVLASSAGLGSARRASVAPERFLFDQDKDCSGWTFEVKRNTPGAQWVRRGPYETFHQMLRARARFRRMGFRVKNIREVCSDDTTAPDTTPGTTPPSTPAPGVTLSAFRKALLDMEGPMPWPAFKWTWRWDRGDWIEDVRAATTPGEMSGLLIQLEQNTMPDVFKETWKARRSAWTEAVRGASTFEQLETLRAEFAAALIV